MKELRLNGMKTFLGEMIISMKRTKPLNKRLRRLKITIQKL
jgi:hypothetical protein